MHLALGAVIPSFSPGTERKSVSRTRHANNTTDASLMAPAMPLAQSRPYDLDADGLSVLLFVLFCFPISLI